MTTQPDLSSVLDDVLHSDSDEHEYYPGSRRKRREAPKESAIEFVGEPWRDNFIMKTLAGKQVPMYTIGALADALGTSVQTIRTWTKQSIIPESPFRMPSTMIVQGTQVQGRRLYMAEEIDAAVKVFQEHDLLGRPRIKWKNHPDVPVEIREAWVKIAKARVAAAKQQQQ